MPTNKKKISVLLLCFVLNGCSRSSSQTEDTSVSFLPEVPKEEITVPSFQQAIREPQGYCYFLPPKGWDLADQSFTLGQSSH
jgi:hypothetical protein